MRLEATWGEFTAIAASRLEYALAAVADAEERSTPGQHAARSEALAGTCRLLDRYVRRFGPLAHDPLGISEDDVARLQGNLQTLGRALRVEAAYAPPEPDPVARHVADAGRFIAIGSDLLASHHGPDGEPRSPYAAYLDSTPVARHVIAETAELGSAAGRLAARLGQLCPSDRRVVRSRVVARRLAEPAVLIEQAAIGINRQLNAPRPTAPAPGLAHLPVAATTPPSPVRPGEPQHDALFAVAGGMDWLAGLVARQAAERVPGVGVHELSAVAEQAAAAHLLGARLIEHTSPLLSADSGARDILPEAAHALRTAARAWKRTSDSWKFSTLGSSPQFASLQAVREAEFAVVRLGRTLFSSGWTHRDGARRSPRAAQEIIGASADTSDLLGAVHAVSAAGQVLAEHTPRIVTTLVDRGVILSSDPVHNPRGSTPADQFKDDWTRWYSALPEQILQVTAAYNDARQASAAAQLAIARAAEAVGHPLGRAVLDADRRRTLGFTGDPVRDVRRVSAAAARARSATVLPRPPEPAYQAQLRAAELAREVAALHPSKKRAR